MLRVGVLILVLFGCCLSTKAQSSTTALPPWSKGFFDIHHISTGRGNATFLIFPDGTTMLIDAGDISDTHPRTLSPRNSIRKPNAERSAPAWIVDYIKQFMPESKPPELDYALITHFHDDHFGEWDQKRKRSSAGDYLLSGIVEVGDMIPIHTLIDRGFDYPVDLFGKEFTDREANDEYHIVQTLVEYKKYINFQSTKSRLIHQTLKPGAKDQIIMHKAPNEFPDFQVRNISVNGQVWTGYRDNDFFSLYKEGLYPGENPLSTCIKISFGKFDYFTGGDISGVNAMGEGDLSSMEANVAPVTGPVDVATLNHHGNRDSQSAIFVRTIRPRVWIQQCWSSDHPGDDVLRRITSQTLYPGQREIFTTDMLEANKLVIGDRIRQNYKNDHGHVVVRVSDGGASYSIYVLNDLSIKREVLEVFGPYLSR